MADKTPAPTHLSPKIARICLKTAHLQSLVEANGNAYYFHSRLYGSISIAMIKAYTGLHW